MKRASAHSSMHSNRNDSRGTKQPIRRNQSYSKRIVSADEAYLYALRVAYLAYLLQPRQKRVQHVANTSKPIQRSATSINDMLKDFSLISNNKSTRFPHGFMDTLDKRIAGVLTGGEKMPEYNDPLVKRTFATFLNEFRNPPFRKSVEKDRRVEDLLLIFFSKATTELQKGKTPDDDSWKLMVDRHLALFVRLISSTLANNDWSRDRPELSGRLKTLETKLLQHDQDLADASQRNGGQGGTSIEVEVPRSYEIRDMPLAIRVCRVFAKSTAQAQQDIDGHRSHWTEAAALRDLKDYQTNMMLGTRVTLSKDDFDLDETFEAWRKGEFHDLSQMMLALIQSDPSLAKTTNSNVPSYKAVGQNDSAYGDASRSLSNASTHDTGYAFDQPVDMSGLNLGDGPPRDSHSSFDAGQVTFTFIPPEPRSYYRYVLKQVLTHDQEDEELQTSEEPAARKLISKPSMDLLNEIAMRWRIPHISRLVLLLDVLREKFQYQQVSAETLDVAFTYVKEAPPEPKKVAGRAQPAVLESAFSDRSKWTLVDYALLQTVLSSLHDALLREFFELFQHCYENKAPSVGVVIYILENHIYPDPLFNKQHDDLDAFAKLLTDQLRLKAKDKYSEMLAKTVPDDAESWEFHNVMELGRAVTALCAKIRKRYSHNPTVMGVTPLAILVEEILPSYASDAKEIIGRIIELVKARDQEIHVQDGFDLYKALVEIREVHSQALPGRAFGFHVEALLQDFVWRWISSTDSKLSDWIAGAVAHDDFQTRQSPHAREAGEPPTNDERHSQSAIDVFVMFDQSINHIIELRWDDDLQYAKFMTAISKSVGKGIAKYCELLESKFIKEMDRQTPEQEAKAQQSSRDKWLAAARDWTSGGASAAKIEPFHFWPESLVKINDIEFATLRLDRLEKEMNVDACVAAIQKYEPAPPRSIKRRGESKYMFTIKIIEAEDLKAGDMNGLSDPYVVLGDEYQKRLAKTRTIYSSLNPRWDETVDLVTTGPLNIIATVWDWDALGDHDCLGRTSLKLDPSHFNDYLPREYWLDLDTQGRVLVRVSMEGERDDIQFYFGKAFRTLKRTQREMTRKITDKLSAYIQQCLSRRTLKSLTAGGTIGGVSINSMRGYLSKVSTQVAGRPMSIQPSAAQPISPEAASNALKPLLQYFDDNFAVMKQTLTDSAMIMVMTRLWKEVLVTIEALLVPPLSDKPSLQKPLTQQEFDIVFKWSETLYEFFLAKDRDSGIVEGVPEDVLKSPKWIELRNLNFWYFESTEDLIRTSENMASATAHRRQKEQQEQTAAAYRLSAPAGSLNFGTTPGSLGLGMRRSKSILLSRNLGTMRKVKEEKRKEAQADPSDDVILRILRMRLEAERYLKDRSRQKERLAAAAAAEAIVRQSLQASRHGHSSSLGGMPARRGGNTGGLGRRWDTIRE